MGFQQVGWSWLWAAAGIVVVLVATLGFAVRLVLGVRASAPGLTLPVVLYIVVLSVMVVAASATGQPTAVAGAFLFYCADALAELEPVPGADAVRARHDRRRVPPRPESSRSSPSPDRRPANPPTRRDPSRAPGQPARPDPGISAGRPRALRYPVPMRAVLLLDRAALSRSGGRSSDRRPPRRGDPSCARGFPFPDPGFPDPRTVRVAR
ncbi:lysoplasmalogenase family protein [Yinghuangia aomiensis]